MPIENLSKAIHQNVSAPLRAALDALLHGLGFGPCPGEQTAAHKLAFTIAVVALSAKMARADGVVSQIERDVFRDIFKASPQQARDVDRVFELAQQDVAGFESYARQIADMLASEPQLKCDVFEGLFNIAAADGVLHAAEEKYLRTVAEIFGYDDATYRSMRARFVYDPEDAYTVLELTRAASNTEVRAQYRRLVRENHPDVMIARGVPEAFVDMANRKLAAINAAYEKIERERGL